MDSRTILVGLLRKCCGYETLEAMNGTEAIEKAAFEKPDLILMDLNLPDISGIDAARAVKAIADTRIFQSLRKRLGVRGNGREKY